MKKIPCEVYSRVVGYYRPVNNWNRGKRQEFSERVAFDENTSMQNPKAQLKTRTVPIVGGGSELDSADYYKIFTFPNCSKCEEVKEFLSKQPMTGSIVDLKSPEGNKEFRKYYSKGSIKKSIKRDDNGALKLPVVIFMKDKEVISTAQSLEQTRSILN